MRAKLVVCVVWLCSAAFAQSAAVKVQSWSEEGASIRIEMSNGQAIVPPPEIEQAGVEHIAISPDKKAVGWTPLFPNYGTSYPIPLGLLVLSNGKIHRFVGNGLAFSYWCFSKDSRRVAFRQETVHGGRGVHYELREIASERLVASYEPKTGPNGETIDHTALDPAWVKDLDAKQRR